MDREEKNAYMFLWQAGDRAE